MARRATALKEGVIQRFLELTRISSASSGMYLQNVSVAGSNEQPAMLALAVAGEMLRDRGVCRIHGGGFGGTVQAFVPLYCTEDFCQGMDHVFGEGACQAYHIDHEGARAWRI